MRKTLHLIQTHGRKVHHPVCTSWFAQHRKKKKIPFFLRRKKRIGNSRSQGFSKKKLLKFFHKFISQHQIDKTFSNFHCTIQFIYLNFLFPLIFFTHTTAIRQIRKIRTQLSSRFAFLDWIQWIWMRENEPTDKIHFGTTTKCNEWKECNLFQLRKRQTD